MSERRTWILIVALVAVFAGTRWLVYVFSPTDGEFRIHVSNRSDYVLTEFDLRAMGRDGKPAMVLRAPRLTRDPDDRSLHVDKPDIDLFDDDGRKWDVVAREGWLSEDGEELRLIGPTRMNRREPADARISIRTSNLHFFPERDHARTDAAVTIRSPGSILRGRGMEADLATERIQLLSEVTARYAPPEP